MPTLAAQVTVYSGDTLTMRFRFSNASGVIDLSAWTWRSEWKTKASIDIGIEMTVDATAAAIGILVVKATPAQTKDMAVNGIYDIQGTLADGTVWTPLRGTTLGVKGITD